MQVSDAVRARRSVRSYLDRAVDEVTIRQVIERASLAPSGGNIQPWQLYVYSGEALIDIRTKMAARLADRERHEEPGYEIYPRDLPEHYRARTFEVGEMMYASMGVAREDKAARRQWFARNFSFFDAPVGLFCYAHQVMGPPQWADLGMFLQTLMLLLKEAGLDSCAQECWALYPDTIREITGAPDDMVLFCGMAIGYADPIAAVNSFPQARVPMAQFATFNTAALNPSVIKTTGFNIGVAQPEKGA